MKRLSFLLLLCCALPLQAEEQDADHADVQIDPLPAGWSGGLNDAAHTFFMMNDDAAMVQINSSWHSASFEKFCKVYMEREAGALSLQNQKVTDPQPASVGPKGTLEYDITGKDGDTTKHYHIYMMPIRKTYAFMDCRCDENLWEKYKKVFEELVKTVK